MFYLLHNWCRHLEAAIRVKSMHDNIGIGNQKEKIRKSKKCIDKSPSKRWFRNGIHRGELMPEGALTSFTVYDIIYEYFYFADQAVIEVTK